LIELLPGSNFHHIPEQVWHITHRCHKQKFLLKFARDRKYWFRWLFETKSGYNEIQYPPQRYVLLNREKLIASCGLGSDAQLQKSHKEWIEEAINGNDNACQPEWSESIAVGSEKFVRGIQEKLLVRTKG
jgi:capsid protein